MNYDHEAIHEAYKSTSLEIIDGVGIFKVNIGLSTEREPFTIDQSLVDAARAELDSEYAKVKYKDDRKAEYPDWGTQLDYIYHNGIDKWKTDIVDPVKAKYPKPS